MKKYFLFLVISVLFFGCDKVTTETFRSYVHTYFDYEELYLSVTESGYIDVRATTKTIGNWKSKGDEKKVYNDLCEKNNDLSYNTEKRYIVNPNPGAYYKGDILSIDVVSDKDFNADYPAGTSLGNIVRLISASPTKYIQSGYKTEYDWATSENENLLFSQTYLGFENRGEHHPINKMLSELIKEDLFLMGNGWERFICLLKFEQIPEFEKEHTFTVTINVSDGNVFEGEMAMSF